MEIVGSKFYENADLMYEVYQTAPNEVWIFNRFTKFSQRISHPLKDKTKVIFEHDMVVASLDKYGNMKFDDGRILYLIKKPKSV